MLCWCHVGMLTLWHVGTMSCVWVKHNVGNDNREEECDGLCGQDVMRWNKATQWKAMQWDKSTWCNVSNVIMHWWVAMPPDETVMGCNGKMWWWDKAAWQDVMVRHVATRCDDEMQCNVTTQQDTTMSNMTMWQSTQQSGGNEKQRCDVMTQHEDAMGWYDRMQCRDDETQCNDMTTNQKCGGNRRQRYDKRWRCD